jgi:cyanate lyase
MASPASISLGSSDRAVKLSLTDVLLQAKEKAGLSFDQLAEKLGVHEVYLASCFYGQNSLDSQVATQLGQILSLPASVVAQLQASPFKNGLDQTVPTDPLIYRFHEVTQIYGMAMKSVIHEKFGDGIMSAIDFTLDVQKQKDPKGDRVVVTYSGKFLPYKKW